ncbi:hypothetical protein [Streptomyces sp. VNUA24]|uniref:hypothetical protein n=1 Tax=Streptomyces sp. VNUA24 TaxID=3031131 RepID=UPI0023B857C5|nr:hypothetical protein [Streptomyces sp. VNUA24]WEH13055.1 hypothetical protein PYR72_04810 [Streptomyces sp. VNUA24]
MKRLIGVTLASVTAFAFPMTADATAAASPEVPQKAPSQTQLQQLDRVATAHSALGVFGEAGTSSPLLVLPSGTSAAEKAQVKAEIPAGLKVRIKVSKLTRNEVSGVFKTLKEAKWHKDARKYGVGYTYDGEKDKVVVNLEAPKSAASSLQSRFPDAVETMPGRFTPNNNRFNDYSPFWGGGSINGGGMTCTAGFTVKHKVDGQKQMITASHCFDWNTEVRTPTGNSLGRVTRIHQWIDAEAIAGNNYTGRIYTGGYAASESNAWVSNYTDWMYWGRKLCVSGQTTFNHCGHPISYSTYGFCYMWFGSWHCVDQNDAFLMDRGGTNNPCYCNGNFTKPGDSGAPVYEQGAWGDAIIAGIHHGAAWNYNGADRMINIRAATILRSMNADMVYGDS